MTVYSKIRRASSTSFPGRKAADLAHGTSLSAQAAAGDPSPGSLTGSTMLAGTWEWTWHPIHSELTEPPGLDPSDRSLQPFVLALSRVSRIWFAPSDSMPSATSPGVRSCPNSVRF